MCGRYTLCDPVEVGNEMAIVLGEAPAPFAARFNVSPSQLSPVVKTGEDGRPAAPLMRWGLVPFWDQAEKPKFAPVNARSEEMMTKPTFRQSVQRRRCAVPADGFFEWKRLSPKTRLPHFFTVKGRRPFFIAGLFESATATRPETYALLTCGPNAVMAPIHDRMPVILEGDALRRWLQPGPMAEEETHALCVPFPGGRMDVWPVSQIVNSPRHDGPECVVPVAVGEVPTGELF